MFGYLSPLIFPLFGEEDSQVGICLDITKILQTRALPGSVGNVRIECASVIGGITRNKKVFEFVAEEVLNNEKPQTIFLSERADALGFLEVSFFSENLIFIYD